MAMLRHWTPSTVSRAFTPASVEAVPFAPRPHRGRVDLVLQVEGGDLSQNVKNTSLTITAEVEIPPGPANGTIIAQSGRFGGWALSVKDGKPQYDYNWLGMQRST